MTPDHEQVAEEREQWTIYRDNSGYIRARGSDLLNGPRFAEGVVVVPEARALTAEQERDAAIRAVFDAAPTQWAEIALDKAGFSDEQIRAALSHHPPEDPDA